MYRKYRHTIRSAVSYTVRVLPSHTGRRTGPICNRVSGVYYTLKIDLEPFDFLSSHTFKTLLVLMANGLRIKIRTSVQEFTGYLFFYTYLVQRENVIPKL